MIGRLAVLKTDLSLRLSRSPCKSAQTSHSHNCCIVKSPVQQCGTIDLLSRILLRPSTRNTSLTLLMQFAVPFACQVVIQCADVLHQVVTSCSICMHEYKAMVTQQARLATRQLSSISAEHCTPGRESSCSTLRRRPLSAGLG